MDDRKDKYNDITQSNNYIFGGRFQPPHLGHLSVVEKAYSELDSKIIIGVVNPDPKEVLKGDQEDWPRFTPDKNPLNYWERRELLRLGLGDFNISNAVRAIVPLPRPSVNNEKADRFLPEGKKNFILVDRWQDEIEQYKERTYKKHGYGIVKIDERELPKIAQLAGGTLIRNLAAIDDPRWGILVPELEVEYLSRIDFGPRVKELIDAGSAESELEDFFERSHFSDTAQQVFQANSATEEGLHRTPKEASKLHDLMQQLRQYESEQEPQGFGDLISDILYNCFSSLEVVHDSTINTNEDSTNIFHNRASSEYFEKLRRQYDAEYIVIKSVNKTNPSRDDIQTLSSQIDHTKTNAGFIIYNSNELVGENVMTQLVSKFSNENILILPISSREIGEIIARYLAGGKPESLLSKRLTEFET